MKERLSILCVVGVLVAVPAFVLWQGNARTPAHGVARVITLTGVAAQGTWTLETVNGLNYWWKRFEAATIHLELGESVLLRLQSADVFHQFYAPALDIGPVDVEPGKLKEIRFQPRKAGLFQYYCTSSCGGCHFYMRGWIVVTRPGEEPVVPPPIVCPLCTLDLRPPPDADAAELGEYLYRRMGCITCHGVDGRGGVENYNYAQRTVPRHDRTAEKLFLASEEDAAALLALLRNGAGVNDPAFTADIAKFPLVKSRLSAAVELIRGGKDAARLDMAGPTPPLQMPAWKDRLTATEIRAILAYFVSLFPWDEQAFEEEDE